jgi:hypothetical protein
LSKRSTTLGRGSKYDFTKDHKNKCASIYNSQSDFDPKNPHSPRFTFGISRSHYEKVYYETNKMIDKNVPGPGKYDLLRPFGDDGIKFSIRGKEKNLDLLEASKVPGPGSYKPPAINTEGKFPLSNFSNIHNVKFGGKNDKRFNYRSMYWNLIL